MKVSQLPGLAELQSMFDYDPATGLLTWKAKKRGRQIGEAGGIRRIGKQTYRYVKIDYRSYGAHRLVWKIVTGEDPVGWIDHQDNNGLNNRWSNLRSASSAQNNHNRRLSTRNTSGVKGVSWDALHKSWRVVVMVNYKNHFLGYFPNVEDATRVAYVERERLHGEFARYI